MSPSPRTLRSSNKFSPKSISGLALWLDASQTGDLYQDDAGTIPAVNAGDPVGYWRDRSGNGRHATQSTAANRPAISASAQNGKKTVTFTGSPKTLTRAAYTAENGLSGLTRIAVCTMSSGSSAMLSRVYNGGGDVLLQTVSSQLRFFAGSSFYVASDAPNYAAIVGTAPHIVGSVYDGTAASAAGGLRPYLDGTALPQNTISGTLPTTLPTGTPDFWLGSNIGVNNYWPGVVLEYITYSRALTNAERSRLERYLAAKWGITLAPQVSNADAQDWVNRVYAAGSTVSQGVANAVSAFVDGCQADGTWNAMKSVVLLAGADTLPGALVPLKGTAPTNNGFVTGDYNRKTGLAGNGVSKSLDSNRNNNADPQDNKSFSVYVSDPGADGGVVRAVLYSGFNGTTGATGFGYRNSDGVYTLNINHASAVSSSASGLTGFVGASRSASANFTARIGGASTTHSLVEYASQTPNNANITLYQTGGARFSSARLAFYHIGESLNLALLDARVSAMYAAIGAALP